MGAPHNTARYGETWDQARIDATMVELEPFRTSIVVSGGWAWHFMSPEGHVEYKHAHDHKDVDFFIHPTEVRQVFSDLRRQGFAAIKTRFDNAHDKTSFKRFEKIVTPDSGKPIKIVFDLFTGLVPFRVVRREMWRIVEPEHLLSLYKTIHGSEECFSVSAARRLLENRIDPVGHPTLVEIPAQSK